MKKTIMIIIITTLITGIISIGCTYAATTYAISASKVGYSDNSSLGAANVQAAIDGTCGKVNSKLSSIEDKLETKKTIVSSFNSGYTLINDSLHNNYYAKTSSTVIINIGVYVKSPTTNVVFNIPTDYRPRQQVDGIVWQESSVSNTAFLTIKPNGDVMLRELTGTKITSAKVIGTISYAI